MMFGQLIFGTICMMIFLMLAVSTTKALAVYMATIIVMVMHVLSMKVIEHAIEYDSDEDDDY